MIKLKRQYYLSELAAEIAATLNNSVENTNNIVIKSIAPIKDAAPGDITFLVNSNYCST